MIPHIPKQRQFKTKAGKSFNDLVAYIEADNQPGQERQQERSSLFDDILNYTTDTVDKNSDTEKCIAMQTSGINGLATASIEMNALAKKNTRCQDPAYHIILSWPEHEKPDFDAIFDAARHALKALSLIEHQYVLAIHGNTDNMHCHICVNRVHPVTFKAQHLEWATRTLHRAARESEIKHGWSHDNGLYVVEIDAHGQKQVVRRIGLSAALDAASQRVHPELGNEEILAVWHDPGSLESWLKTKVARALKPALAELTGWSALHAWLSDYDITLSDSGGAGMRLRVTSPESGEMLDLAASKGLRLLKREVLEKRWGPFANSIDVACVVPDLSHLTPKQIAHGVQEVLSRYPQAARPPAHVIAAYQGMNQERHAVAATELTEVTQADASGERSFQGDDPQRAQRKEQRAAARAELRLRFLAYQRLVRGGDPDHFTRIKGLKSERSLAQGLLREQSKAAKLAIPKDLDLGVRLIILVEIDAESLRRKLEVEADFQKKSAALRANRTPPLSWRAWLYEQSNLGDQAALSALRGIVYQAQRDAKRDTAEDGPALEDEILTAQAPEKQFRKVMARLLEEEKKEAAIRSANSWAMRPYQVDALLAQYAGMQWRVTGNGNVEYRDQAGGHLFTDRGNRLTFDRVRVLDEEICLALAHAQHKFGSPLTLTGDDPVFTARMARLACDMKIAILNPELQSVMAEHRTARDAKSTASRPPAPVAPVAAVTQTPTLVSTPVSLPTVVAPPAVDPAQATRPDTPIRKKTQDAQTPLRRPVESSPAPATHRVPQETARGNAVQTDAQAPSRSEPTQTDLTLIDQESVRTEPVATTQETASAMTRQDRLRALVLVIDPSATFVIPDPFNSPQPFIGKITAKLGDEECLFAQHRGRSVYVLHDIEPPNNHNDSSIEVLYRQGQARIKIDLGQGQGD